MLNTFRGNQRSSTLSMHPSFFWANDSCGQFAFALGFFSLRIFVRKVGKRTERGIEELGIGN
jgi:hypothetical protein